MYSSSEEKRPFVLDIGQCDYDHRKISRLFEKLGCDMDRAASPQEAKRKIINEEYDLILVNRILDQDGSSGLDLIGTLIKKSELEDVPIMLVSDHPDAQNTAIQLGAFKGFGKMQLSDPDTEKMLIAILFQSSPA